MALTTVHIQRLNTHGSVICDSTFISVFIHGFDWFYCTSVIYDPWWYLSRRRNTTHLLTAH
jgi:hypothetical protein